MWWEKLHFSLSHRTSHTFNLSRHEKNCKKHGRYFLYNWQSHLSRIIFPNILHVTTVHKHSAAILPILVKKNYKVMATNTRAPHYYTIFVNVCKLHQLILKSFVNIHKLCQSTIKAGMVDDTS